MTLKGQMAKMVSVPFGKENKNDHVRSDGQRCCFVPFGKKKKRTMKGQIANNGQTIWRKKENDPERSDGQ